MAEKKLHAIMIALPFQGHITPFINLALKLASNGYSITFVHTEFIHHMLSKSHNDGDFEDADFFVEARKSGLDIRYMTISDGFPPDYDRILNLNEYWESMLRDFPSRVDEFVGKVIESDEGCLVHFLVADSFYSWPAAIAEKYSILNVSFWTEPAVVLWIGYHLDFLIENGYIPYKGNRDDLIDFIPEIQPIKLKDLMSYLQDQDMTTIVHQIVTQGLKQVKSADFILMNTIHEFENQTLLSLNKQHPAYAVGPISFSTDFTKSIVPKSLWPETDCTEWLNLKPPGSVLYVSFGSLAEINKQLTEEIAYGLLLSEVNFIWVLRDDTEVLPDGFKNEMKDRGLIVPWCNQNAVISNPAIGGFLTHCGWNSILESIWCGVPMICYPFFADQPTNRKLVVDDWKIGINLCDGNSVSREEVAGKIKQLISDGINLCDGISVTREEIAAKIKQLMSGETSDCLRYEIKKMRTIMQEAVSEDGSTKRNFDQFLTELRAKAHAKSPDIL